MTAVEAVEEPAAPQPFVPQPFVPQPFVPQPFVLPSFVLPAELEATEPAEVRGAGRDDVRLLVAQRATGAIEHHHFPELPELLEPGDLLVVNTSATVPAALAALDPDGAEVRVHLSGALPGSVWLAEVRRLVGPDAKGGTAPDPSDRTGESLLLPGGGRVHLLGRFAPASRLWLADLELPACARGDVLRFLAAYGEPIRYGYIDRPWPLSAYQNVYAREPGSAEMASAGRALTPELITDLIARGVDLAPLVLHTGVSSQESHEPPYPERYDVPLDTARRVNAARASGGRVIAIGTTVVRALETVADARGQVHPGRGWTELMVTPATGVRAVDGLLSGWHEPEATHLLMLEAVGGTDLVAQSYDAALAAGYLWHEFGDLHLLLP
jgi:S-adenosylmethionine:tRNA ribosyltransferase-isomerase